MVSSEAILEEVKALEMVSLVLLSFLLDKRDKTASLTYFLPSSPWCVRWQIMQPVEATTSQLTPNESLHNQPHSLAPLECMASNLMLVNGQSHMESLVTTTHTAVTVQPFTLSRLLLKT